MGTSASLPEPAIHRSLNCRVPTTVEFVNDTGLTVQTVWINYHGEERVYFTLAPGGRVHQPTYTAHPWRFHAPDAPDTLCVIADQAIFYPPPKAQSDAAPPQFHIVLAGSMPWSPRTHAAFPDAFRLEAATLLGCHHRLQPTAYHSAVAGGAAAAGLTSPLDYQQQALPEWLLEWLPCLQRLGSWARSRPGTPLFATSMSQPRPAAALSRNLGDLPQELLLMILAAAAPSIPLVVKPPVPHGVQPGDLPTEEAAQLFRTAGSDGKDAAVR